MDEDQRNILEKEHQRQLGLDHSFQGTFGSSEGIAVLEDLKTHCGYEDVCFYPEERKTDFMLGARSVFVYIQDRLQGKISDNRHAQLNQE